MKLAALVLVFMWFLAVGGAAAVAGVPGVPGDKAPPGPAPPDDLPPELPVTSPAIRCSTVPEQDEGSIGPVVYSRDGTTLITGNMHGMLRWFDATSGRMKLSRRVIPHYRSSVTGLARSPDGQTLASNTDIGEVSLLDATTGVPRLMLEKPPSDAKYPTKLYPGRFSSDGKRVACWLDSHEVLLYDVTTGRRDALLPTQTITQPWTGSEFERALPPTVLPAIFVLAVKPDGQSGIPEKWIVRTWDLNTGREVARWEEAAHGAYIGPYAFAPDNSIMAMSRLLTEDHRPGRAGRLELRDPASGRRIAQLPTQGWINDVKFLPDGKTLVSLEDHRIIRLYNVATARQLDAVRLDHHNHLENLAVAPDGKRIAAAGYESAHIFGVIYQFDTDGSSLTLWKPQP